MNKLNKLFAGFAAVAMLAACSNDEPTPAPNPGEKPSGDIAYLAVTISAPETGSRATTDGDYVESDAVEKEHKVTDVQFFFFDARGGYTGLRAASSDSQFVPADNDGTNAGNGNIEYIGKENIVVLEGLKGNDYPEYVITVLNAPDFRALPTMQETADALDIYAAQQVVDNVVKSSPDKFVMTTSSFFGDVKVGEDVRHDDTYYYATKLVTSDFKLTREDAATTNSPVDIYVERLAAKVQVGFAKNGEDPAHPGYYKIETTLAGGGNVTEDGDNVADVALWVKVKGWTLNALAENSYMSKKLDADWKSDASPLWKDWNKTADWRSFWAKSHTYTENPTLFYASPMQMIKGLKAAGFTAEDATTYYCYENTNSTSIFEPVANGSLTLNGTKVGVNMGKVTHAIIYTQIVTFDKDGNEVVPSLVQYRGLLYLEDSYKAMILNNIKAQDTNTEKLNFWKVTTGTANQDGAQYAQVSDKDLDVVRAYDKTGTTLSEITVVVSTKEPLYSRTWKEAVGTEGEEGYVAAHYEYSPVETSVLEALVAAQQTGDNKAIGADEGEAIYKVPIEHLAATSTQKNAVEGYYGVVRNHWYQLTINNFKKVGYLLFDPDTDETKIIPGGPEDPLYYVGAKINILSWKVVNQNVEL